MARSLQLFLLSSCCIFLSSCGVLLDEGNPALDLNRRVVRYVGVEVPVYVEADMPTIIVFPGTIISELWQGDAVMKQVQDNYLTVVAWPGLSASGETVGVRIKDGRPFRIWVVPVAAGKAADKNVTIVEGRDAEEIFREQREYGFR